MLVVPWSGAIKDGVAVLGLLRVTGSPELWVQANVRAVVSMLGALFLADSATAVPGRTRMSGPASAVIVIGDAEAAPDADAAVTEGDTTATLSGHVLDGTGAGNRPML